MKIHKKKHNVEKIRNGGYALFLTVQCMVKKSGKMLYDINPYFVYLRVLGSQGVTVCILKRYASQVL